MQVDAKMLVLETKEGRFAPGKRRKHHRLDRFLLQYNIRQFGTKTLARKKLRQFVSSIRYHLLHGDVVPCYYTCNFGELQSISKHSTRRETTPNDEMWVSLDALVKLSEVLFYASHVASLVRQQGGIGTPARDAVRKARGHSRIRRRREGVSTFRSYGFLSADRQVIGEGLALIQSEGLVSSRFAQAASITTAVTDGFFALMEVRRCCSSGWSQNAFPPYRGSIPRARCFRSDEGNESIVRCVQSWMLVLQCRFRE